MNAPCQVSSKALKKKIDLPPTNRYSEEISLHKNAPHKTKSSKLMQQLQQKKTNKNKQAKNKMLTLPNKNYTVSTKSHKNCKSTGSSERFVVLKNKYKGKAKK